jgi:hypothetical protein
MTKSIGVLFAASGLAALIVTTSGAHAQPKGDKVTITGEVVDTWCYLEGDDHGAAHRACATTCAKAGNAIAILDSKGTLYLTAGMKDHQPARDVLIERMGQNVAATGTLVKKGGLQMLYVESVK